MAVFRGKYFGKISVHSRNNGGYEVLKIIKNEQNDAKNTTYPPLLHRFSEKQVQIDNK